MTPSRLNPGVEQKPIVHPGGNGAAAAHILLTGAPEGAQGWLKALLETTLEGVLLVGSQGTIRYSNPQAGLLFGWRAEHLHGLPVSVVMPDLAHPASEDGAAAGLVNLGRRKDGSRIQLRVQRCLPGIGSGGDTLYLVSDLSESIEAQRRLEMGEQRFDHLFRAFPAPVFVWQWVKHEFILIDFNDAALSFTQGGITSLKGCSLPSLYADQPQIVADFERVRLEKVPLTRDLFGYRMRSSGEVRDITASMVPIEPDLVLAIIYDTTSERHALNEWKKLSSAVEQTADAVFITNRDGVIEYVNPAFESMTGFSRAESVGNTPRILKSGQMPPDYYQQLWGTVLQGKPFRAQTVNRRRSGEVLVVEQTITPMQDERGQITHFVSVLKDMTERLSLQEEQAEQHLAGLVQKQLFPSQPPQVPGYDIAGAVFPAKTTSGDYYDYLSLPGDALGIVVADVVDHGLASALIMSAVRAYLRLIVHCQADLRQVLVDLNERIFPDLADSNFITMLLARLDPQRHVLEYANAGNWPGLILGENGDLLEELRNDGVPVGLFPALELRPAQPQHIPSGGMALFMTDGIPEAVNNQGEEFGVQRVLEVIRQQRDLPAAQILKHVRQAVVAFIGSEKQADDQTLILCRRLA